MNRLLILSENATRYAALLRASGLTDLHIETAADAAAGCNIIMGDPNLVRDVIGSAAGLEWVQSTWAGVDALCTPGLRRDYVLTGVKGVFGALMAEYVLAYLFGLERQVFPMRDNQAQRRWQKLPYRHSREITVGCIGLGSIGGHIARAVAGCGLRVTGLNRTGAACEGVSRVYAAGQLAEFLAEADYVVLSLPETRHTRGFIDAARLRMMKPSAVLINVGRGSSVVESDLVAALNGGVIGGAVLDVFGHEPLATDSPLWTLPNVYVTPHSAARSFPEDIGAIFVDNYRRFMQHEPLLHVVNFEAGY